MILPKRIFLIGLATLATFTSTTSPVHAGGSALAGTAGPASELTLALAKTLMAKGESEVVRLRAPGGAIALVDGGGHLVLLERLDDTFPAAATVSTEKARTAALFRMPTENFETAVKNGRNALLGVDLMTPLQGGVPIRSGGRVIGAVGVSGTASAAQDTEIANAIAADPSIAEPLGRGASK